MKSIHKSIRNPDIQKNRRYLITSFAEVIHIKCIQVMVVITWDYSSTEKQVDKKKCPA